MSNFRSRDNIHNWLRTSFSFNQDREYANPGDLAVKNLSVDVAKRRQQYAKLADRVDKWLHELKIACKIRRVDVADQGGKDRYLFYLTSTEGKIGSNLPSVVVLELDSSLESGKFYAEDPEKEIGAREGNAEMVQMEKQQPASLSTFPSIRDMTPKKGKSVARNGLSLLQGSQTMCCQSCGKIIIE